MSTNAAAASDSDADEPALEAFFRGAGLLGGLPPEQTEAFLYRLGQLMRAMLVGLAESLQSCGEQRRAFNLPGMDTQLTDNHVLESSADIDEALANLLLLEYAPQPLPVDAVRRSFDDVNRHHRLMLGALREALDAYIARLDPAELEQKFSSSRGNMLVSAANRLKYWDLYKDLYDVVAHHPQGQLPSQFIEDLAKAYERELGDAEPCDRSEPRVLEAG